MIWKTPMELIKELQRNYGVHTRQEFGDTLEFLKGAVEQLENAKNHFQRKHLEVWQFLDEHYPEAGRDFDILQSGGELE